MTSTACNSCPRGWESGAEKANLCRFHLTHAGGQELNPGPDLNKRCISALLLVERRAPPNSHLLPTNRVLTSESSLAFVPKVVALELLVCSQVPRPRLFPRFCHVLALEQVFCIHVAPKQNTCNFVPRTLIRIQDCTAHLLDRGIEWFRERERLQPLPGMSLGLCRGFTQIKVYHEDLSMGPCTLSYIAQAFCASIKGFGESECSQYSLSCALYANGYGQAHPIPEFQRHTSASMCLGSLRSQAHAGSLQDSSLKSLYEGQKDPHENALAELILVICLYVVAGCTSCSKRKRKRKHIRCRKVVKFRLPG